MDDFNLIITTLRSTERQAYSEMSYLLKDELGDPEPFIEKTGIRGLLVAKVSLDPLVVIEKLRKMIHEYPYRLRYALRVIPIQKVVDTNLDEIRRVSLEFGQKIGEDSSFRVTIEKRFTSLHSRDLIEAAASEIKRKINLSKPDSVLLIEVLGELTGISLIKPQDILAVTKEKML